MSKFTKAEMTVLGKKNIKFSEFVEFRMCSTLNNTKRILLRRPDGWYSSFLILEKGGFRWQTDSYKKPYYRTKPGATLTPVWKWDPIKWRCVVW